MSSLIGSTKFPVAKSFKVKLLSLYLIFKKNKKCIEKLRIFNFMQR